MPPHLPSAALVKPLLSRNLTIALSVVLFHVGLIWALQSGLLVRVAEVLIPVEMLSQWVEPPAQAQPKPQPTQPTPVRPATVTPAKPVATTAPAAVQAQPLAVAAQGATATVQTASAPAAFTAAKSTEPMPAAAAPAPAPAMLQQPSSNADYLQNPKPAYPSLSARLGETGKTIYKVWIGVDGKPQRAELVSSSGFPRLDKAAYDTVMAWRYVPGMRNGVAEVMAVNVPIHWELRS